eukprot:4117648-Pleurochrysis_carterae.AAC.1
MEPAAQPTIRSGNFTYFAWAKRCCMIRKAALAMLQEQPRPTSTHYSKGQGIACPMGTTSRVGLAVVSDELLLSRAHFDVNKLRCRMAELFGISVSSKLVACFYVARGLD